MTQSTATIVNVRQIVAVLKKRHRLWLIPTVVATLLSLGYAVTRPARWEASQALLVRDEAGGKVTRPGRFDDPEAMKTAQETIVEVAQNFRVVESALRKAGPASGQIATEAWPTEDEVNLVRKAIRLSAPKGAELGKTEVLYLYVSGPTRERALQLTGTVCDEMDTRLQDLRHRKAESIIAELENTVRLAQTDLDEATARLEAMESEVGSDLGELRILNDSGSGDSNLRTVLSQIKNELRQARAKNDANQQQLELLTVAQSDPAQLVATPNQLLESQPSLRRLKDALVDAQIRKAELAGKLTPEHPLMQAAVDAERLVRADLHDELDVAIRGLKADFQVSAALVASLERQTADVTASLDHLAKLRARYGNLVADVRQRTAILEAARTELSDARASQAAAQSASLLTRLDAPQAGNTPTGPGKSTIVGCGMLGGLLTGFGLVLLLTPLGTPQGRRLTDQLKSLGRRATDRLLRRRASDQPNSRRSDDPQKMPVESASGESTAVPPFGRRGADRIVPFPSRDESSANDRRAADAKDEGRRTKDEAEDVDDIRSDKRAAVESARTTPPVEQPPRNQTVVLSATPASPDGSLSLTKSLARLELAARTK